MTETIVPRRLRNRELAVGDAQSLLA